MFFLCFFEVTYLRFCALFQKGLLEVNKLVVRVEKSAFFAVVIDGVVKFRNLVNFAVGVFDVFDGNVGGGVGVGVLVFLVFLVFFIGLVLVVILLGCVVGVVGVVGGPGKRSRVGNRLFWLDFLNSLGMVLDRVGVGRGVVERLWRLNGLFVGFLGSGLLGRLLSGLLGRLGLFWGVLDDFDLRPINLEVEVG